MLALKHCLISRRELLLLQQSALAAKLPSRAKATKTAAATQQGLLPKRPQASACFRVTPSFRPVAPPQLPAEQIEAGGVAPYAGVTTALAVIFPRHHTHKP